MVFFLQIQNIHVAIDRQANWHVRTVVPHTRQRGLDHELVPGMATGHKTKGCLHFHVVRAACLRCAFSCDETHSR